MSSHTCKVRLFQSSAPLHSLKEETKRTFGRGRGIKKGEPSIFLLVGKIEDVKTNDDLDKLFAV